MGVRSFLLGGFVSVVLLPGANFVRVIFARRRGIQSLNRVRQFNESLYDRRNEALILPYWKKNAVSYLSSSIFDAVFAAQLKQACPDNSTRTIGTRIMTCCVIWGIVVYLFHYLISAIKGTFLTLFVVYC